MPYRWWSFLVPWKEKSNNEKKWKGKDHRKVFIKKMKDKKKWIENH